MQIHGSGIVGLYNGQENNSFIRKSLSTGLPSPILNLSSHSHLHTIQYRFIWFFTPLSLLKHYYCSQSHLLRSHVLLVVTLCYKFLVWHFRPTRYEKLYYYEPNGESNIHETWEKRRRRGITSKYPLKKSFGNFFIYFYEKPHTFLSSKGQDKI